jgi:hypothetical protein
VGFLDLLCLDLLFPDSDKLAFIQSDVDCFKGLDVEGLLSWETSPLYSQ